MQIDHVQGQFPSRQFYVANACYKKWYNFFFKNQGGTDRTTKNSFQTLADQFHLKCSHASYHIWRRPNSYHLRGPFFTGFLQTFKYSGHGYLNQKLFNHFFFSYTVSLACCRDGARLKCSQSVPCVVLHSTVCCFPVLVCTSSRKGDFCEIRKFAFEIRWIVVSDWSTSSERKTLDCGARS